MRDVQQPRSFWFSLCLFAFVGYYANLQLNLVFTRRNNGVGTFDKLHSATNQATRTKAGYRFIWNEDEEFESSDQQPDDYSASEDKPEVETRKRTEVDSQEHQLDETSNEDRHTKDNERRIPRIAWLASYPNSGTSYTMTMVERSTNLSTATNYGLEIAFQRDDSIPLHEDHPEGPYWEGLSGKRGTTIRELPETYALTKTHCGGRCINCPATEWKTNTTEFLKACQRTSAYRDGVHVYGELEASRVARVIHLIRNPFHNIVARFHLERRHLVTKNPSLETKIPNNATGFRLWCDYLDNKYGGEEGVVPEKFLQILRDVPCRAEWYKYVQWHNLLIKSIPSVGDPSESLEEKVLVVHYEDYETNLDATVARIMAFLEQEVVRPLRPFRALPDYSDHYSDRDRTVVSKLAKSVASKETWLLIRHYFEDELDKEEADE